MSRTFSENQTTHSRSITFRNLRDLRLSKCTLVTQHNDRPREHIVMSCKCRATAPPALLIGRRVHATGCRALEINFAPRRISAFLLFSSPSTSKHTTLSLHISDIFNPLFLTRHCLLLSPRFYSRLLLNYGAQQPPC